MASSTGNALDGSADDVGVLKALDHQAELRGGDLAATRPDSNLLVDQLLARQVDPALTLQSEYLNPTAGVGIIVPGYIISAAVAVVLVLSGQNMD